MIRGVGTDIIEIARIEDVIRRRGQQFLDRLFTQAEQKYCKDHVRPSMRYAGRWAAKESIVKALGTGLKQGITWVDMEILNDSLGKPILTLSPHFQELYQSPQIHVSISHCDLMATAIAVWED